VPVDAGERQLRAGVRAFLADDYPHPAGQDDRSSMPVISVTPAPGRTWPPLS
jgi:hypothetical protein